MAATMPVFEIRLCFVQICRVPKARRVDPLGGHLCQGGLDGFQVLPVSDPVPLGVCLEDADGAQALVDLCVGHTGEKILPLQGIFRQRLVQKCGHLAPELI